MEGKIMKSKSNNKGFTLVELIIVIAIMALLAASIAPSVIRYIEKARKTKVLHEARIVYDQCQRSIGEFDSVEFKGQTSPNGQTMSNIAADSRFSGKFNFICCYNSDGCLYVEVLHDGYFVHFDGNQTIDDVYSASRNPNMAFSNVN